MYIKELAISNFRGFIEKPTIIEFNEGLNVLIGANNAGKTTILNGLELLFSFGGSKNLKIEDFNQTISIESLKNKSPKIIISATIIESENENPYSDELITVANWLTKIETPYHAKITYEFSLPENEELDYLKSMEAINSDDVYSYWKEIEFEFLRKYTYKIFVGKPEYRIKLDGESIKNFDYQLISAIRDVERDMFRGSNPLLKEIIDFFIDYDIKVDATIGEDERKRKIRELKRIFTAEASNLISKLQSRMDAGKKEMLKYVDDIGASLGNSKPAFDGRILDTELYSALKLIVEEETGIKLPANRNGLGYNNLIFISLLLAKMQKDSSKEYLGSNAKTFSILAMEEPEAHLHPNLQYKLLKFLDKNKTHAVNQIFVTTHSPNITSAVELDSIINISKENKQINISYPSRVFSKSEEDIKSKKYIQRFLDVTKADMFFAKKIILVEGLSEQILIPAFAESMGISLIDEHISVININGRYFNHFLKLFDKRNSNFAINKKVVCITDKDSARKLVVDSNNKGWTTCLPIEYDVEPDKYQYVETTNPLIKTKDLYDDKLIKIVTQNVGTTFEYELAFENNKCKELVIDSMTNSDNLKDMIDLMANESSDQIAIKLINTISNEKFKEMASFYVKINDNAKLDSDLAKHIFATRYLKSVKKGEVAQELSYIIYKNNDEKTFNFNVPQYIKEALKWIVQ